MTDTLQPPDAPLVPQEGRIAELIIQWVHAEWELREFSAVTTDEGLAIKAHASELAEYLASWFANAPPAAPPAARAPNGMIEETARALESVERYGLGTSQVIDHAVDLLRKCDLALRDAQQQRTELEVTIKAIAAEKDVLRARANAAEYRQQAAECRATRIKLDEELKADNAALTAELSRLTEARDTLQREQAAEDEAIRRFTGGEPALVSTGIHGGLTYGYGALDGNGFWEFPLNEQVFKHVRKLEADPDRAGQALRKLQQQIRERAEDWVRRAQSGTYRADLQGAVYRECADELAALLPADPEGTA